MIKSITFVTGNEGKFKNATALFTDSGIELNQLSINTPEIQSNNSSDISKYSAEFVCKSLNEPFFVMDRSFSIDSLNGFPGPFVKYINQWFTSKRISQTYFWNRKTQMHTGQHRYHAISLVRELKLFQEKIKVP